MSEKALRNSALEKKGRQVTKQLRDQETEQQSDQEVETTSAIEIMNKRAKKTYNPTFEDLEVKRIKKNAALKAWRSEHKQRVTEYMRGWYANRKEIEKRVIAEHKKLVAEK